MCESTNKYKYCNHHHELTKNHTIVNFGNGEFVANNDAIPLLKALNEIGLKTRSHHIEKDKNKKAFITILMDNVCGAEVRKVQERDSTRTKYDDKDELTIVWDIDV